MPTCNYCGNENDNNHNFCSNCGKGLEIGSDQILNGRFKVLKVIENGGMGVIYLAEDKEFFNSLVAIKEMTVPTETFVEKQKRIKMFDNEAQILFAISHSGIPKVISHFEQDNRYYLVMQYIDGKNLRQIVEERGKLFSKEETTKIAQSVLDILSHLHSRKPLAIIHSDIKPENIMLTPEGEVKLVDFGITCLINLNGLSSRISRKTIFGTPWYIAPEIISEHTIIPQSDIYSLGKTMLWMLTGKEEKLVEALDQLQEDFSTRMYEIITTSIAIDYSNRFGSAEILMEELKKTNSSELSKKFAASNRNSITRPSLDDSTVDRVTQALLLSLEDIYLKVSNTGQDFDRLIDAYRRLVKHISFFGTSRFNFDLVTQFLLSLINWKDSPNNIASQKLTQIMIQNRASVPLSRKVIIELMVCTDSDTRYQVLLFMRNLNYDGKSWKAANNWKMLKQTFLDNKDTVENKQLILEITDFSIEELIQIFLNIDQEDLVGKKYIIYRIMDMKIDSLVSNADIQNFYKLLDYLFQTQQTELKKLALDLLLIHCNYWNERMRNHVCVISIEGTSRNEVLKYLDYTIEKISVDPDIQLLPVEEKTIKPLLSMFAIARGWSKLEIIAGFCGILIWPWVIDHIKSYRIPKSIEYKGMKRKWLSYLDRFVSHTDSQIQQQAVILSSAIAKI